jgi:hypothetical protein
VVKKRKIIVIPSAGLGNRMRVLSSCVQIAIKDDRTLWIVWPNNAALGCDITDIFQSIGIDYYIPPKWIHFLLAQIYRHGAIKRFTKAYKLISRTFFDSSIFDEDTEHNNQPKINRNDSAILVATCFAFGSGQNYKLFKFTDYLENEADREYKQIGEPYIGIHIRRTDHVELIKHSPLENYLTQIDRCILDNPRQKFFLATDDEETKIHLRDKYENLIYSLNHKLGRAYLEGIHGAVIELLLLSRSSKIICSKLSSYSDTAIALGNIKKIVNV